jgi:tripartite-type tricarboxylate transporter receptor subunit TctC
MVSGVALAAVMVATADAQSPSTGSGQGFPNRPIRFIVPYVAGGAGDIFARVIGAKLGDAFGQQVVIDNRPGANGIIGTDMVAKAAPDGHTIVMANSAPFVLNPSLYKKLPYDAVKDFAPVSQGTYYAYVLIVHPSVPAKSVQELVAYARTRNLSYGSTGTGSANHLAGEFLAAMNGVKLIHVQYKGSAAALTDVLAGQIPMMFDTPITTIPQLKAGKVRALAFSGKRRTPQLPDVATMEELGFKGFEVSSWQGVIAPGGTPKSVVDRLYQETVKALKMPDVIERLATQGGNELVGSTPDQYAKLIREEITKYAKIIKDAGIRIE